MTAIKIRSGFKTLTKDYSLWMEHSILQMSTALGSVTKPDNLSKKSYHIFVFLHRNMIAGVKKTFLVFMLSCKGTFMIRLSNFELSGLF